MTVNGDTITGVTETSTGAPVSAHGRAPIRSCPAPRLGIGLSNYTITYVNGTLTVNPAPLTITANNASKTYGTDGDLRPTAFTETGLVTANGDTITGVTETSTGRRRRRRGHVSHRAQCRDRESGLEQLHDHLCQRHADRQPSRSSFSTPRPAAHFPFREMRSSRSRRILRRLAARRLPFRPAATPRSLASVIDVHGGVQQERQRDFQPRAGDRGRGRCRPARRRWRPAEHLRPDQLWLGKPEREFDGDDQTRHLQPDHRLGQRQAHLEQRALYIIEGGGFTVSGNASITGSGVMIFNAGSNYPSTGGTYGSISLSGNGNLQPEPTHQRDLRRNRDLPAKGQYQGPRVQRQRHQA